jgi:hypothetical protein
MRLRHCQQVPEDTRWQIAASKLFSPFLKRHIDMADRGGAQ